MNKITFIALLSLSAQLAFGKDISINDLTPAAKRVADTEARGVTLKKVESVKHQGKDIYALTFQRPDGTPKYIFLNLDGTYVTDAPNPASAAVPTTTSTQILQLSQLPEPVRKVVQTETRNGPVSRILQVPNGTATMYQVDFRQPNGQDKVIYLNPDGSYVQNASGVGRPASHSWDVLGGGSSAAVQTLTAPQVLSFSQLPAAVQTSLRGQAGASRIQNIQSGQLNGKTVYQADIDRNGQKVQVRVDPAGTLLTPSSVTPR